MQNCEGTKRNKVLSNELRIRNWKFLKEEDAHAKSVHCLWLVGCGILRQLGCVVQCFLLRLCVPDWVLIKLHSTWLQQTQDNWARPCCVCLAVLFTCVSQLQYNLIAKMSQLQYNLIAKKRYICFGVHLKFTNVICAKIYLFAYIMHNKSGKIGVFNFINA